MDILECTSGSHFFYLNISLDTLLIKKNVVDCCFREELNEKKSNNLLLMLEFNNKNDLIRRRPRFTNEK